MSSFYSLSELPSEAAKETADNSHCPFSPTGVGYSMVTETLLECEKCDERWSIRKTLPEPKADKYQSVSVFFCFPISAHKILQPFKVGYGDMDKKHIYHNISDLQRDDLVGLT